MERLVVRPGSGQEAHAQAGSRIKIERANLSYLEDRGWTKQGARYSGKFKTRHGEWWGEAELVGRELNLFIYDVPKQVQDGPHGACFETHIGNNWWWVHFWKESSNPGDEIMAIERVLEEAFDD